MSQPPETSQGFGSFRSQDVEVLVRQSDTEYTAPVVVVADIQCPLPLPAFGLECRNVYRHLQGSVGKNGRSFVSDFIRNGAQCYVWFISQHSVYVPNLRPPTHTVVALFLLDNEWTFVNHGAFGAANRLSFETAQKWQRYLESQPLRYIDRVLLPQMAHVTRLLAQHVGTDACDLGLLPNATSGLNAVIQSIPLTAEDSLYILSLSYGSVKKMAKETCRRTGAEYCEAQITFAHNSSSIDFVALVERELPVNAKVAVFDHVTSNTAIVLPIQELTDLCHRRGCLVVVDGAHGLGQFDLNLRSLGADVYVSNCHKWFTCPKGIGFVRATAEVQKWLRPVIISHGWGKGFVSEFMWQGTSDYSAALSIPSALTLWNALGAAQVRKYCRELLIWAATSLAQKWNTQTLVPLEMSGLMALVQIPTLADRELSDTDGNAVQDAMHFRFQIECPVKFIDGQLYVRISSHCYNTRHDYDKLASAVLCLVKDLKIG